MYLKLKTQLKQVILLGGFGIINLASYAQLDSLTSYSYEWEEDPKLHTLGDSLKDEGEVVLKLRQEVEFTYSPVNGQLEEYQFIHKILNCLLYTSPSPRDA